MITRCACHGRILTSPSDTCPCDVCGEKSSIGGPSGSFCSEHSREDLPPERRNPVYDWPGPGRTPFDDEEMCPCGHERKYHRVQGIPSSGTCLVMNCSCVREEWNDYASMDRKMSVLRLLGWAGPVGWILFLICLVLWIGR